MKNKIVLSHLQDPFKWELPQVEESPFNMEAILRADSRLLDIWKQRPFYFDINSIGEVVVLYIQT